MLYCLNSGIVHDDVEQIGLIVDGKLDSVVDMIVAAAYPLRFVQRSVVVDG